MRRNKPVHSFCWSHEGVKHQTRPSSWHMIKVCVYCTPSEMHHACRSTVSRRPKRFSRPRQASAMNFGKVPRPMKSISFDPQRNIKPWRSPLNRLILAAAKSIPKSTKITLKSLSLAFYISTNLNTSYYDGKIPDLRVCSGFPSMSPASPGRYHGASKFLGAATRSQLLHLQSRVNHLQCLFWCRKATDMN